MSFATVVPYALIIDGPQALRWWTTPGEEAEAWDVTAEDSAAAGGGGGGGSVAEDDEVFATSLGSLALYLGVSGVLLFLHSAVRGSSIVTRVGENTYGCVPVFLPRPSRTVWARLER